MSDTKSTFHKNAIAKMVEVNGGAMRFDTGKPELHHIHPVVWQSRILGKTFFSQEQKTAILTLNKAMDEYFYYNNPEGLFAAWPAVEEQYIDLMVKVLEFGAKKYASLNYAKGMKFSRVLNSFRRHIQKMGKGEQIDEESGIDHMGHLMCNFMFMLLYMQTGVGEDDRVILKVTK